MAERHEVAVVGAGLAGLSAAWHLRDRDVVVLEAEERVGGRIRSEPRGRYWLNWGAHVFGGPGSEVGRLAAALGLDAVPAPGVLTALELGGRVYAGGRVETLPLRVPLSARERVSLLRAGLRLRLAVRAYDRVVRPRAGEPEASRQARTLAFLADRSFADFLGPVPPVVESLFRPTITRSSAEPGQLSAGHGVGYFHLVWRPGEGLSRNIAGGSSLLTTGLAAGLPQVLTGVRAVEVEALPDRVVVRHEGGELEAAHAIVATPAHAAAGLLRGVSPETLDALGRIPYGPYVVVSLLTAEAGPQPWDAIYALATPGRAFNMVFNLANVLRPGAPREPGGSLMLYSGGERLARPLLERADDEIVDAYLADLDAAFPGSHRLVSEALVQRWPRALPYPFPGRQLLQPALTRPLGRVHLAGDYLGSFYTETAARTGREAAAAVRAALERE